MFKDKMVFQDKEEPLKKQVLSGEHKGTIFIHDEEYAIVVSSETFSEDDTVLYSTFENEELVVLPIE